MVLHLLQRDDGVCTCVCLALCWFRDVSPVEFHRCWQKEGTIKRLLTTCHRIDGFKNLQVAMNISSN